MSTQEGQEIINKWKEEIASYEERNILSKRYGLLSDMAFDAEDHPEIARELSTMYLNAIDKLDAKERDHILKENFYDIRSLGRLDYRIFDDVLKFADKRKIQLHINLQDPVRCDFIRDSLFQAMDRGIVSPKLLMKNVFYDNLDVMAFCVAKDPSLVEDFLKADKAVKEDKDQYKRYTYASKALYQLSTQLDKLPEKMTPWLLDEIRKFDRDDLGECIPKTFFNIVRNNVKYMTEYQKDGYKLLNNKDAEFVAKIYEDLQNRVPDTLTEKDVKKNRPISSLTKEEQELSKACKKLLQSYEGKKALKVKLAKQYPMSAEAIRVGKDDYISMCINNLENPEKENIRSILNRLEAIGAKTYEDFADAVDFVHRRDMCRKVCRDFKKAQYEKHQQNLGDDNFVFFLDDDQLSYGMAEAGIKDKKTAEKVVDMFVNLNDRPETYGSSLNRFYPKDLKDAVDVEEWMYPIIKHAVYSEVVNPSRLGGGQELFAACKAWKINPRMPKAIAEQVGEMSLAKRMVAGAIVDDIGREQVRLRYIDVPRLQPDYWLSENPLYFPRMNYKKELIPEFWKEMSKAQEMSFGEAMKTYIPDTPINRKRFVAAMLEEMGVENTEAKYQQTYKNLEENGKFEEFLASDSKEQRRERVERIKQNKAKVQEKSTKKKSIREAIRERLAKKNIIPETGAFGEGHKITANKDMSQFNAFVDEKSR